MVENDFSMFRLSFGFIVSLRQTWFFGVRACWYCMMYTLIHFDTVIPWYRMTFRYKTLTSHVHNPALAMRPARNALMPLNHGRQTCMPIYLGGETLRWINLLPAEAAEPRSGNKKKDLLCGAFFLLIGLRPVLPLSHYLQGEEAWLD